MLADRFSAALAVALGDQAPRRLGIALSGGGDSVALTHLLCDWARGRDVTLAAVTVNHGLRAEAAAEAEAAGRLCAALGIAHEILAWDGTAAQGNLPAAARHARYRLIADWARRGGIDSVALGHTLDDQAETVLLRLARGSGVDGLGAMRSRRHANGVDWLRPMLALSRRELRDHLRARGVGWAEDPTNDDIHYDRVKARRALALLAPLGVTAGGLARTADRLQAAGQALGVMSRRAAMAHVSITRSGDVRIASPLFAEEPAEVIRRIVAHALSWVASAEYGPRGEALTRLLACGDADATLHGCRVRRSRGALLILREYAAVREATAPVGEVWDRRWCLSGPARAGLELEVRALGESGLKACPDWRASGLERASLIAAPAVWSGSRLEAAPLAGRAAGWSARLARGGEDFFLTLLSH